MADEQQAINLKVLSPSAEVEGGVNLAQLPASTTVQELRIRIQDAVPSKPATERMRLIYRGRVVANDADTLSSVFGAENIRENPDQSLHLVLREMPTNGPPSLFTAPPNPFRPAQGPAAAPASPLQTNPFRTLPQSQPRPSSQPQTPQPQPQPHHHHHLHNHPHAHHHHHHLPGLANPYPPNPYPPNPFALPLPPLRPQNLQQNFAPMPQEGQQNNGQPDTPATSDGSRAPLPGAASLPPLGLPNLPNNGGQTVRQERVGPNGARWTVTYNQVNIPARLQQPNAPFPVPHNLGLGLPPLPTGPPPSVEASQRVLPRIRTSLLAASREMGNIRALLHTPGETGNPASFSSVPAWRMGHARRHLVILNQNLDLVDWGLTTLSTDALFAQNPEMVALRRSALQLRADVLELNMIVERQEGGAAPNLTSQSASAASFNDPSSSAPPGAPIMTPAVPTTSQTPSWNVTETMPAGAPAELFLLSSPQGPVGILFDQQGTYTTAPMVSTLPFQAFTNQFAQNRQLIAGLGQQMAQGPNQLHSQLANIQPTPTQQPMAGGQAQDQNQAQDQVRNDNQNFDPNANPAAENDRVGNVAQHLWLIVKLAAFVWFFSGGNGLYRPIMLGIIAALIYLAQVGIFEDQINLARRHFEALLPIGALADGAAQPNNQGQGQQRAGNVTPEETARRLLQQRQTQRFGWARDSMRTIERAFALFVASLFPGVGERMVHAQEERVRLERVAAEEERQRQEDEARRREEEAQAQQDGEKKKSDDRAGDGAEESTGVRSAKGKERAVETEGESASSAS
ncbi:hypothetical protein BDW02DRAFT_544019 [Decorospora gaudefroyi]|uniref:Ubiquitin-like domain-containing protein n=1 Tax=Decorospora gaudefroyi TaxID=184978 RepID=A0A6A5KJT9_9PLEO|nr:hypothetical protein BDW02DRAFT_544019 [Decorospora gaudefroyi]